MDSDTLKSKKRKLSPELIAKKRELMKAVHEFNRGRKLTDEHKQHLKENHVGNTGGKMTDYVKAKLKEGLLAKGYRKGFKLSDEHKRKIGVANANPSNETRERKSLASKKRVAEGTHPFYKGGVTILSKIIRQCYLYRQWCSDVFTRDDFTCQFCGKRGGELAPDHIKAFSDILKENNIDTFEKAIMCAELWDINNGRTLCRECHKTTDTFGWNHFNKKNK